MVPVAGVDAAGGVGGVRRAGVVGDRGQPVGEIGVEKLPAHPIIGAAKGKNGFVSADEMLIGEIAYKEEYLFVLPQFGFGARSESLFYKFDDGYFNVKLFIDASVWLDYHLETFSTGVMFNFEHDLPSAEVGFISDNRFNVSFILTK